MVVVIIVMISVAMTQYVVRCSHKVAGVEIFLKNELTFGFVGRPLASPGQPSRRQRGHQEAPVLQGVWRACLVVYNASFVFRDLIGMAS